jgi:hypothetical protein
MTSPIGKLTAAACHQNKFVNKEAYSNLKCQSEKRQNNAGCIILAVLVFTMVTWDYFGVLMMDQIL